MSFISENNDDFVVTQLAEHQSALLAFLYTLLPGDSSVHDVLQKANIVIWKKRKDFKKGTNFKSWAFSITHWEVRAYLKDKKRKSWLVIDEELTEKLSGTMVELVEESAFVDLSEHLQICLGKLKPQDQELLHHHYYSDQPLKVHADKVGRPVTSLKTTLGRLRISLRKCLDLRADQSNI